MIAFFDTEFVEHKDSTDFASIGIVREDGVTLHRVSAEVDLSKASWWFKKHVWKQVAKEPKHSLLSIGYAVREILQGVEMLVTRSGKKDAEMLEFVSGMNLPLFDLQTSWQAMECPPLPRREGPHHHALHDALYHKAIFDKFMLSSHIIACWMPTPPPNNTKNRKRYTAKMARLHELELTICT